MNLLQQQRRQPPEARPPRAQRSWFLTAGQHTLFCLPGPCPPQAVYTAGVLLPKPVAECQYWHRSLNPKKLISIGFRCVQGCSVAAQPALFRCWLGVVETQLRRGPPCWARMPGMPLVRLMCVASTSAAGWRRA